MTAQLQHIKARVTRPADTVQYAAGDHVSNSTSASDADYLTFPLPRSIRSFAARSLVAIKSSSGVTTAAFRLHLLSAAPSARIADNAALSALALDDQRHYLGYFDFTFSPTLGSYALIEAAPAAGEYVLLVPDANAAIDDSVRYCYGVLEARGTYTPASEEVIDLILHGNGEVEAS